MALQSQLEPSVHAERYHAVAEIAEMWKLIADKVRELFDRELGVLAIELLFVGVCPDRVETVQSQAESQEPSVEREALCLKQNERPMKAHSFRGDY